MPGEKSNKSAMDDVQRSSGTFTDSTGSMRLSPLRISSSRAKLIEFNDDFWKNYGLLIMTDLLSSRVRRGWMPGSK